MVKGVSIMKNHQFTTAFQIYLPEDLGIIGNIVVHLETNDGNYDIPESEVSHISHYKSVNGSEWMEIFNNDTKITNFETLKSSTFSFPIDIWDGLNGTFYLTFTAWRNDTLTYYYTGKRQFMKSQKLILH